MYTRKDKIEWARGLQGDANARKTLCASAVADWFGVTDKVRYLHTISDLVRAVRKSGLTVRSRKSAIKGKTIGAVRKELKRIGEGYYIVRVEGHVLLLNSEGKTVVDTDPRKRDKRKITHIYYAYGV